MSKAKIDKFIIAIKNMSDLIHANQISNIKFFPVSFVTMNQKGHIIAKKINKKRRSENNEHHAEFLCLKNIEIKQNKRIILFVTIPPCEFCFKKIISISNEFGIIWEIYYLNDDIREKINNKFRETFKNSGNKIKKLYISKLKNK